MQPRIRGLPVPNISQDAVRQAEAVWIRWDLNAARGAREDRPHQNLMKNPAESTG
jgi:hypothetical protein